MNLCPDQESCNMYGRKDDLPKNHDIRNKYKCMWWVNKECIKQGDACNLNKVRKIRKGMGIL